MAPKVQTLTERLERHSIPEPNSGCWLWTGAYSDGGYGLLDAKIAGRRETRAHRVSYHAFVGPIPVGLFICHRCDVPCCVNPDHLFLGTPLDNTRDMIRKGRGDFRGRPARQQMAA